MIFIATSIRQPLQYKPEVIRDLYLFLYWFSRQYRSSSIESSQLFSDSLNIDITEEIGHQGSQFCIIVTSSEFEAIGVFIAVDGDIGCCVSAYVSNSCSSISIGIKAEEGRIDSPVVQPTLARMSTEPVRKGRISSVSLPAATTS